MVGHILLLLMLRAFCVKMTVLNINPDAESNGTTGSLALPG